MDKLKTPITNSTVQQFHDSTITITNRQRVKKINSRLLKEIAVTILAELKIVEAEVEINLVGEKKMTQINETFLRHEGSTDVITFDYSEKRKVKSRSREYLRGETFVCVDEAILQSKKFKTNWQSEIVRYVVHGILHLLGHDDLRPDLRRKMKRSENLIMRQLAKKFSLAQIGGGSKLRK